MGASADESHMRLALRLAARGRGKVEPNPMVGAVVVRGGKVIGKGWHRRFGGPHAEVNAVRDAHGKTTGATVYVTLEPCAHFGKTPPCADFLIEHKVRRVVVACRDLFPETAGKGIARLRRAGIRVEVGLLGDEARSLNAPFFKLVSTGMPHITAKWAMTLDGKIATKTGDSKWISSEGARKFAHKVRGRVDAVVVGIGTVLADDPELTCRLVRGRTPRRVVLDTRARLPLTSKLVRSAREAPVIVAVSDKASAKRTEALMKRGCKVVTFPAKNGRVDVVRVLEWLGSMRVTNVLVEGGGEVLGSFFDAKLVDEVLVFVGPKIVGGGGKSPVLGSGVSKLADAAGLELVGSRRFGSTVLFHARVT